MNRRDFLKSIGVAVAALLAPKAAQDIGGYYMPPELPPWFVRFVKDHADKRTPEPDDGGYLVPPEITEQLLELQKLDPADRHIENWTTIRWHAPVTDGEAHEGEWEGPLFFRLKG